jgi:integrator complex subunit 9
MLGCFIWSTTEPEFSHIECLAPYQPLAMKAIYCPIDTSLNFQQTNKLLKELKPNLLVTHEEYLNPPRNHPHRTEFVIDYSNVEKIRPGSVLDIKLEKKSAAAMMDPLLAGDIEPNVREGMDAAASTITATLDNMNNKYRLLKVLIRTEGVK